MKFRVQGTECSLLLLGARKLVEKGFGEKGLTWCHRCWLASSKAGTIVGMENEAQSLGSL